MTGEHSQRLDVDGVGTGSPREESKSCEKVSLSPHRRQRQCPTTADVSARGGRPAAVASKPYTPQDIRFTQSKDGKTLYAIVLAIPADGKISIKSLAGNSPNWTGNIGSIHLLGVDGDLKFTRDENGLHLTLPEKLPSQVALALKIQS